MNARPVRLVVVAMLVAAGTWFVAHPAFGAVGKGEGNDQGTARVVWRAVVDDGPSDLAADADGIVVTSNVQSVRVLDANGRLRWRVAPVDVGLGQPTLGRDVVVVGGSTRITVLARSDGTERWTRPVAARANSVAVADNTVLVGDDTGTLAAFDVATGAPRWSVHHPGALWSGARVDEQAGVVVATWHQSEAPAVRVLDLATGALHWEAPTARFSGAPAVHGGRVLLTIGDGDRHARVEARDLTTGAVQWRTPVPASFEEAIEPAVDDHAVAVVDHFGVVTVLDPGSGRVRWQHDLAHVLLATRVTLTEHRVALTSYAGVLHVLDRGDGHVVARIGPARLGGLPVAVAVLPHGRGRPRSGGLLLALRLRFWGVQLRRLE